MLGPLAMVVEWWLFWVQVVYTLITLCLVVVALFGETIRNRWFGPRFVVEVRDNSGFLTARNSGARTRYYHLSIRNSGETPARKVRVVLIGFARRVAETKFSAEQVPIPLDFMWSFPQFSPLLPTISQNSERICDLGHVDEGTPRFEFDFYVRQNAAAYYVAAAETVRVHYQVEVENLPEPVRGTVEVKWDGKWSADDNEMIKHLQVKLD